MTDAGGFLPTPDDPDAGERGRMLRQIADALNLPVSAFSQGLAPVPSAKGPSAAECAAMLAAFSRIRDPQMRRHCLEMLEHCAEA